MTDESPVVTSAPAAPDAPAGVYVHVPFCAHICPYCDFNTYSGQDSIIPRYVDAVVRDIAAWRDRWKARPIDTIFLGGGTPSLLTPGQIGAILQAIQEIGTLDPAAEITIEANPNGLTEPYLSELLEAGVNRLSIGVQTLSPKGLRRLGRLHEPHDATAAFAAAHAAGFRNLSADFIFGWPSQQPEDWDQDLDVIAAGNIGGAPIDHVSLYSLIVEPGTPMADAVRRNIMTVPDDDAAADMYESAIDRLAAAGWLHYEVANWSRSPDAMSRHNRIYWRNGDFIGVGAGAHGTVGGIRWMNHALPRTYAESIESGQGPAATREILDDRTMMGETMMLGLRLLEDGVNARAFAVRHGLTLDDAFCTEISALIDEGLIDTTGSGIRLSRRGLMLANDVCARFL